MFSLCSLRIEGNIHTKIRISLLKHFSYKKKKGLGDGIVPQNYVVLGVVKEFSFVLPRALFGKPTILFSDYR